jgi:hypothetical protein
LLLERINNPFVVAPDFKMTDLDGETGQLAGAYVGRLLDNTLLVGGAAYWLVSGNGGEEMGVRAQANAAVGIVPHIGVELAAGTGSVAKPMHSVIS